MKSPCSVRLAGYRTKAVRFGLDLLPLSHEVLSIVIRVFSHPTLLMLRIRPRFVGKDHQSWEEKSLFKHLTYYFADYGSLHTPSVLLTPDIFPHHLGETMDIGRLEVCTTIKDCLPFRHSS